MELGLGGTRDGRYGVLPDNDLCNGDAVVVEYPRLLGTRYAILAASHPNLPVAVEALFTLSYSLLNIIYPAQIWVEILCGVFGAIQEIVPISLLPSFNARIRSDFTITATDA